MKSLADKLNNDERSAVEIAVQKTFADFNEAERMAAEIAVWRATNITSQRIAHLAKVAMEAIYQERRTHRSNSTQITKGEPV